MNYDQPQFQSKENRLQMEMTSWIYQSHLWKKGGIAEDNIVCEWCGKRLGGNVSITEQDDICPENPKIRDMRRAWVKRMIERFKSAEELISKSRTSSKSTETFMSGGVGYDQKIETKR